METTRRTVVLCLQFLGFVVTGSLMMLINGIPAATSRHQVVWVRQKCGFRCLVRLRVR